MNAVAVGLERVRGGAADSLLRVKTRRAAGGLRRGRDSRSAKLEIAPQRAARPMSGPERRWIAEIERLRRELGDSRETVRVTDYGARHGQETLGVDEMARGVEDLRIVGDVCRAASKPPAAARLLFSLIREFCPVTCLELGTSLGISALYQAAALELNGGGRMITLEGAQDVANLARDHFGRLGLADRIELRTGRFIDTLPGVLADEPEIGYVFIDGHHDGPATVGYFDQVCSSLATPGVVVFDDITWSAGMRAAWSAIGADHRVELAVPVAGMGIVTVIRQPVAFT